MNNDIIYQTDLRLVDAAKHETVQTYLVIFNELVAVVHNKYPNSPDEQRNEIHLSITRSLAVAIGNDKRELITMAVEVIRPLYPGCNWASLVARAIVFGKLHIAKLLMTNDVLFHHKKYFLFETAKTDAVELFSWMLETYLPNFDINEDVNGFCKSVFVEAMDRNSEKVVRYIVDELGYDINSQDSIGRTPLLSLVAHGYNAAYIPKLVAMGADVGAVDNDGFSAVDIINKRLEHPREEIIPALSAIKKCLTE